MPRIDLPTSELHALLAPVLPHAGSDKDFPELSVVRLEARDRTLHAVATDRYTLAAARHMLRDSVDSFTLTLDRADVAGILGLFRHTKNEDPDLRVTVDRMPVPVDTGTSPIALGIRIEAPDGKKLDLHDRAHDAPTPLDNWRSLLAAAINRPLTPVTSAVGLAGPALAKWAKSAGKHEYAAVYAGPPAKEGKASPPMLVIIGDHVAGLWAQAGMPGSDHSDLIEGSLWRKDLTGIEGEDPASFMAPPPAPVEGDEPASGVELLCAAAELVVNTQFGSTSMLARKLKVDFATARQLMNDLHRHNIVGPADGSRAREVLARDVDLDVVLSMIRVGEAAD